METEKSQKFIDKNGKQYQNGVRTGAPPAVAIHDPLRSSCSKTRNTAACEF